MFRRALIAGVMATAPVFALARVPDVRLVAPMPGTLLTGGSTAVLKWSGEGIDDDPAIEEWEAFLSRDGGRYYSVRITPHLDIAVREFSFVVPDAPSADTRILIRLGDEREERVFELPARIRIAAGVHAVVPPSAASLPGEAARPGDPGVCAWVDGDRRGAGLSLVALSIPSLSRRASLSGRASVADAPPRGRGIGVSSGAVAFLRRAGRTAFVQCRDAGPPDVLLHSHRLNI
jgi:hypothetical protein